MQPKNQYLSLPRIARTLLLSHYTAIKTYELIGTAGMESGDIHTLMTFTNVKMVDAHSSDKPGKSLYTARLTSPVGGLLRLPYTWKGMAKELECSLSYLLALLDGTARNACSPVMLLKIHNMMGLTLADTAPLWRTDWDENWWNQYKELNLFRLQFKPGQEIIILSLDEILERIVRADPEIPATLHIKPADRRYIANAFTSKVNGFKFFRMVEDIHGPLDEFFAGYPSLPELPNVIPDELAMLTQEEAEIMIDIPNERGPRDKNYLAHRATKS